MKKEHKVRTVKITVPTRRNDLVFVGDSIEGFIISVAFRGISVSGNLFGMENAGKPYGCKDACGNRAVQSLYIAGNLIYLTVFYSGAVF